MKTYVKFVVLFLVLAVMLGTASAEEVDMRLYVVEDSVASNLIESEYLTFEDLTKFVRYVDENIQVVKADEKYLLRFTSADEDLEWIAHIAGDQRGFSYEELTRVLSSDALGVRRYSPKALCNFLKNLGIRVKDVHVSVNTDHLFVILGEGRDRVAYQLQYHKLLAFPGEFCVEDEELFQFVEQLLFDN